MHCGAMERLPAELHDLILSFLPRADLSRLARCCRLLQDIATPLLYRSLLVNLRSGDPDCRSTKLLQVLSHYPPLRHYMRDVEIANASFTFWTAGHSRLLGIVLSTIFTFPHRIRSFSWKASGLFTRFCFANLEKLECTNLQSNDELSWVRWHLENCTSLRTLRLRLTMRLSPQAGCWLLSGLSLPRIEVLSLQGIDLSCVDPAGVLGPSVQSMELEYCVGVDHFLRRIATCESLPKIRSLRLAGSVSVDLLNQLLFRLAQTACLRELSLRIGSASQRICIKCIQPHAPELTRLILDFRQNIIDPRSSVLYGAQELQEILQTFPFLTTLGLPLDLKAKSSGRYRRAKLDVCTRPLNLNSSANLLQLSALRKTSLTTLHIRRHCVDWRRHVRDAKHVAAPFRVKGGFNVFLDHGSRLRKMVFEPETSYFCNATDEDKQALCAEL